MNGQNSGGGKMERNRTPYILTYMEGGFIGGARENREKGGNVSVV